MPRASLLPGRRRADDHDGSPEPRIDPRIRPDRSRASISRRSAMQVSNWGNSLAVRLPAAVVERLGLQEGDEIEIEVADPRHFRVAPRSTPRRALETLRTLGWTLPEDFHFDREEMPTRAMHERPVLSRYQRVALCHASAGSACGGRPRPAGAARHVNVQVLNEFANVASRKLHRPWPEIARTLTAIRMLCPPPLPLTLAIARGRLRYRRSHRLSSSTTR